MARQPLLSTLAWRDLESVRSYTVEKWGRDQWLRYYLGLTQALQWIADDPACGRPRYLFAKGLRSLAYEKHLIFFAPITHAGGAPVVLRIIHQRQNLAALTYYEDLEG